MREFRRTVGREERRRIGHAIHVFSRTGAGDVRKLTARGDELRLRVGDWRVLFRHEGNAIVIIDVVRRDKAYTD